MPRRPFPARSIPAALAAALLVLGGCAFRELSRNLRQLDAYAGVKGTVAAPPGMRGPIVVLAYTGDAGAEHVVDAYVLAAPGAYFFVLPPGTYRIAAFADRDGSSTYDLSDPTAFYVGPVTLASHDRRDGVDLTFDGTARPLGFAFTVPQGGEHGSEHLPAVAVGTVTDFDDPRFGRDNATLGLWQPVEFLFDVGAGIYFLEPYDEGKIPVLFIHGALGTPADWTFLVERLDRERFQPWLLYYPTALPLDTDARAVDRWMQRLYVAHRFPRLFVVAHSMGGLVARAFVNRLAANGDGAGVDVRLLVTMSTPWEGQAAAALGVEQAPTVAPSWYDMAPGSPFLQSVLAPPLPRDLPYHLFFSYGDESRWQREANDGVVALASQLDPRAQEQAVKLYGFDRSHAGILGDAAVSGLLNQILAAAAE